MKKGVSNVAEVIFSTKNRPYIFYVLAFVPFVLMAPSLFQSPYGLAIPLYAFIILLLKKHKLFSRPDPNAIQKVLGLVAVLASFFVYFIVSPFFPNALFYGSANYSLYIVGLFLLFFEVKALKEAFSPLFLVVAPFLGSSISDLAKLHLTSYLPHFTSFITSLVRAIGIPATQSSFSANVITLYTSNGSIPLIIVWGCIGFTSMFIFSVILVLIMSEDPSSIRTKIVWSILGVLGTFLVNIIRLVTIFVGFHFYGYRFYDIHLYMGYVLFISWSVVFLYLFSKRNTISQKIRMGYAKIWRIRVQ